MSNLVLKEIFTGDRTDNTVYSLETQNAKAITKCGKPMTIVGDMRDLSPGCVFIDPMNRIHFAESDGLKVDEYVEIFV